MADNALTAQLRTEFGKGAARRARREGLIPAVLYGHGSEPIHLNLPSHDTFLIVRHSRNAVITLQFDGRSELALVKDVQINPILRAIEHLDLVIIKRGEKVLVDVPVHVEGESAPGTIHQVELLTMAVTAPATAIPENIVVNVEGMEDGTIVRVSDLKLPADVTTETDPEIPVVVISIPRVAAAEAGEAEEAAPAAE